MKRFICLFFVFSLLTSFACAEAYIKINPSDPVATAHYSVFVNGDSATVGKGSRLFEFNSLSIDLYLTESEEEAYLLIACCNDHIMHSSGFLQVSVVKDGTSIYFMNSSGLYLMGEWDENGTDLWLNYSGRSFRLRPTEKFSVYSDWK